MTNRYFFSELPNEPATIRLLDSEARHAIRVMRVQIGDRITLFDGRGRESAARITGIGRSECTCQTELPVLVDRNPQRETHLGIAFPKPDRVRELIERLTELGVKRVTPLIAARTQRPPSESLLEKLRRGVIEACKQSGRNDLLVVEQPMEARIFLTAAHGKDRIIAHPSDESASLDLLLKPRSVAAAVGPEGGWSDEELSLAKDHGFKCIDLGKRIYRIETAAVAIAVMMAFDPGDP